MSDVLKRAKELLAAATPGPWVAVARSVQDAPDRLFDPEDLPASGPFGHATISGADKARIITGRYCCGSPYGDNAHDLRLIAECRTIIEGLVAEIGKDKG